MSHEISDLASLENAFRDLVDGSLGDRAKIRELSEKIQNEKSESELEKLLLQGENAKNRGAIKIERTVV